MGREDALKAVQKEFDGLGATGAWKLESVREEADVLDEAIREQKTIHIADLLAICSEKNVELEPSKRSLKGRVCYRGDAARDESGNLALYQASVHHQHLSSLQTPRLLSACSQVIR